MHLYELAYALKKTVGEIREMEYTEYLGWTDYFSRRPIGWREDNRVMPLLQIKGMKAPAHEVFPSLAAIHQDQRKSDETRANAANLKQSIFFQQMLTASGGDRLPGMEMDK